MRRIIHVDMDAFYAAVEVRDAPELAGKPLIIGSLPDERGVVATCSYEARKYGVRSGMSIKEAYRLCPDGIYKHPDMKKYKAESKRLHGIWERYTDRVEYVALDEGYLDVTGSVSLFGNAEEIAMSIKRTTFDETGLKCSVGVGYSMSSAKLASEEKKPDGFFVIPDKQFLVNMIIDRDIRVIPGIGKQTEQRLKSENIFTVRDIYKYREHIIEKYGKHGKSIVTFALGEDAREVTPAGTAEAKSISREHTFQEDISDFDYLKDVLLLLTRDVVRQLRDKGEFGRTVSIKVKYYDMRSVTRSITTEPTDSITEIHRLGCELLSKVAKRPVRLVGIGVSGFTDEKFVQMTFDTPPVEVARKENVQRLEKSLGELRRRFGFDIVKTGSEVEAEQNVNKRGQL